MAFADKREYAYWLDQSGNNNDWTSVNLTESDISKDTPTNNYCTWNIGSTEPSGVATLGEGGLKGTSGQDYNGTGSTFNIHQDGKSYMEFYLIQLLMTFIWVFDAVLIIAAFDLRMRSPNNQRSFDTSRRTA